MQNTCMVNKQIMNKMQNTCSCLKKCILCCVTRWGLMGCGCQERGGHAIRIQRFGQVWYTIIVIAI